MPPGRPKKRDSEQSPVRGSNKMDLISTPTHSKSPTKQLKKGITVKQKQALIDNLQLEVTERARRLRAQYHLQAQGLRSRIEIRINRIPTALRKVKMADLLVKYAEKEQRAATSSRPPPVPAKDAPTRSPQKNTQPAAQASRAGRSKKRTSDDFNIDKENDMEVSRKKPRGAQADTAPVRPGQILSPTSSNSRLNSNMRAASPAKSQIGRAGSPLKSGSRTAAATSMLSNFVEKAKSSRAAGGRKVTTTSNTSASSAGGSGSTAPVKTRRAAAPSKPPTSRPATRMGRRGSVGSETSEGSTTTAVKKGATARSTAAAAKKKTLGAFSKGTASGDAKKTTAPAKSATPASTTRTGRVLRNRG